VKLPMLCERKMPEIVDVVLWRARAKRRPSRSGAPMETRLFPTQPTPTDSVFPLSEIGKLLISLMSYTYFVFFVEIWIILCKTRLESLQFLIFTVPTKRFGTTPFFSVFLWRCVSLENVNIFFMARDRFLFSFFLYQEERRSTNYTHMKNLY
jgi:hypothetical protein